MSVLCVEKPNALEVSVAPLPCSTQSACAGMAHHSVYPPLPPQSWILFHASQVSYSQFLKINRFRTHRLIPQIPYDHKCPPLLAFLLCLLGTSAHTQHLLFADRYSWGLPVKYTPHLNTRGWQKVQTLFSPWQMVPCTCDSRCHSSSWSWATCLLCSPSQCLFFRMPTVPVIVAGGKDQHPIYLRKDLIKRIGPTSLIGHRVCSGKCTDQQTSPFYTTSCLLPFLVSLQSSFT